MHAALAKWVPFARQPGLGRLPPGPSGQRPPSAAGDWLAEDTPGRAYAHDPLSGPQPSSRAGCPRGHRPRADDAQPPVEVLRRVAVSKAYTPLLLGEILAARTWTSADELNKLAAGGREPSGGALQALGNAGV